MQKTSVSLPVSVLQALRAKANDEKATSRYGYLIERYVREGLERDKASAYIHRETPPSYGEG